MNDFLSGAFMMGSFIAGLFFLKFWKRSRDRLFLMFGVAFWILGLNRIALAITDQTHELRFYLYTVRLAAFLLILFAIIDKNRRRPAPPGERIPS